MIIRQFDIETPEVKASIEDGWEQLPLGYSWMTKCRSPEFSVSLAGIYREMEEQGIMPGGRFQLDCLLSILADIKKSHVNMFELGAGWGRLCLEIAGAVDFHVIECAPKSYRCLAVDAEPRHYQWLQEHFQAQDINGVTVFGAVSTKNGSCRFDASSSPDAEYGQAISPVIGRRGLPSIHGIRKIIARKTVKVPMYTLGSLAKEYSFDHIDIVQMDVQGAEYDVLSGAIDCIDEGIVDYFLINIHLDEYSKTIPAILGEKYNLIVDLKRASTGTVPGFPPIQCHDGIQLYKRKSL